ncbi:MAG: DUF4065 domain-containing protein [Candidatus Omnitrophica bacterium]|nr:DUF4065 domain-containing protein [Candidatus Omnitrophota bacterium]
MKNLYCSSCDNIVDANLRSKDEEYDVRGDKFRIKSEVFFCSRCNEELFDEENENKNLGKVYSLYREKYNLLSVDQIKSIREKYGLSQRAMSRLLDWGEVTYSRYENGTIQDSAHNEVLELIDNPKNMLAIYKKNQHLLSLHMSEVLRNRLSKLVSDDATTNLISCFEKFLIGDQKISEYTGYCEFNLEKLKDIILYIATTQTVILKTKLNKLLWYIDFLFFKTYSISLTGCTYIRFPYGPIPNNYDDIINLMVHEKLLEKNEIIYNRRKGIIGERLTSQLKIDKTKFTTDEIRVMDFIGDYFRKFNCVEITEYSHKEKPYKETEEKGAISYELAKKLSLDLK